MENYRTNNGSELHPQLMEWQWLISGYIREKCMNVKTLIPLNMLHLLIICLNDPYQQLAINNSTKRQFDICSLIRSQLDLIRSGSFNYNQKIVINPVISDNIIGCLVQFLNGNKYGDKLKYEILMIISNLTCIELGTEQLLMHTVRQIINNNTITSLIHLVKNSKSMAIHSATLSVLKNISMHDQCKDVLLKTDLLSSLLNICRKKNKKIHQSDADECSNILNCVAHLLLVFCRSQILANWSNMSKMLNAVDYLINVADTEITIYCCVLAYNALTNFAIVSKQNNIFTHIKKRGIIKQFIDLLDKCEDSTALSVIMFLNNISFASYNYSAQYAKMVVRYGVLDKLHAMLIKIDSSKIFCQKDQFKKFIVTIIMWIAYEDNQSVSNTNLFPLLIDMMLNDEFCVAQRALWAILNGMKYGSNKQVKYLVNLKSISAISKFWRKYLFLEETDPLLTGLESMQHLFESFEPSKYRWTLNNCPLFDWRESQFREEIQYGVIVAVSMLYHENGCYYDAITCIFTAVFNSFAQLESMQLLSLFYWKIGGYAIALKLLKYIYKRGGILKSEYRQEKRKLKFHLQKMQCGYCGKENDSKLRTCCGCMKIMYCNKLCQKKHWSLVHNKKCDRKWDGYYTKLKVIFDTL